MSEQKEKISAGIWLYGYAVSLGVAYIFAFSRPFGLNLFAFFAIQDYLSVPLNRAVIIIALPAMCAAIYFDEKTLSQKKIQKIGFWILYLLYFGYFASEAKRALHGYFSIEFHFRNETSVIIMIFTALLISALSAIQASGEERPLTKQLASLIFIQIALISAAGYADGKGIYAGADDVYFLENKDLCGPVGPGSWVYVTRLSNVTIFMHTFDKRLCLTDEKKYRLISRVRLEGLDQN